MMKFSFDHLTPTDFEEFCYDLLESLGATRMSWRKGTGHDSSPADQGRDIECFFERNEVDGHKSFERWFVECKHYKSGVPPEKLQGALTWANAEQPEVLLIIASHFLSNPAKNNLEAFARNHPKTFKIKTWEQKHLENFSSRHISLLRKYKLAGNFDFLELLHPAHLELIQKPSIHRLDFFLKLLDDLEVGEREAFFGMAFIHILNPTARRPPPDADLNLLTMGDLLETKVNYVEFRKKCQSLPVSEMFLVRSIVLESLNDAFRRGDKTRNGEMRATMLRNIDYFKEEIRKGNKAKKALEGCIRDMERGIATLEQSTKSGYETYCSLCEKVVVPLLAEVLPYPDDLPPQEYE